MTANDDLPTDSVLRRHTITERNRGIGLPPTDAVLRRHHDQWMSVMLATPVTFAPSAGATPATASLRAAPAAAAPGGSTSAAGGGGWLGWLRRLFGG